MAQVASNEARGPLESMAAPAGLEAQWVKEALAGDGQAYAALVRPYLPLLYRIASRAVSNPSLAEDAVQETLTLAWQQLSRYAPGTSLKAFLASIAVRRAHTLLRSELRRGRWEASSSTQTRPPSAQELLEAEATAARLRKVLADMPEKRREAALLRLDAGLGYDEIALALGSTEGSARVLVHLALKELKERLQAGGES